MTESAWSLSRATAAVPARLPFRPSRSARHGGVMANPSVARCYESSASATAAWTSAWRRTFSSRSIGTSTT
jgi:hypothetical protein